MQVFIANKSTFKKGWSRCSLSPEAAEGEIPFHIIEQAVWLNEELNCELSQEFQSDSLQCEDEWFNTFTILCVLFSVNIILSLEVLL